MCFCYVVYCLLLVIFSCWCSSCCSQAEYRIACSFVWQAGRQGAFDDHQRFRNWLVGQLLFLTWKTGKCRREKTILDLFFCLVLKCWHIFTVKPKFGPFFDIQTEIFDKFWHSKAEILRHFGLILKFEHIYTVKPKFWQLFSPKTEHFWQIWCWKTKFWHSNPKLCTNFHIKTEICWPETPKTKILTNFDLETPKSWHNFTSTTNFWQFFPSKLKIIDQKHQKLKILTNYLTSKPEKR